MAKHNREGDQVEGGGSALVPLPATVGGLGFGNSPPAFIAADVAKRSTRMLPRIVTLKRPGDFVDGVVMGEGSGVDIEDHDKATGEIIMRQVKTWNLDCSPGTNGKVVLGLMGSYQIDRELAALVGKRVRVTLLETVDTRSGRRVKDCLIEAYVDAEEAEVDHKAGTLRTEG